MLIRNQLFPQNIVLVAQHCERAVGLLTCVTLGQGALESEWWKYTPPDSNNFFGVKWVSGSPYPFVTCYTKEEVGGHDITISARFAKYPDLETGFLEHAGLLTDPNGPYAAAQKYLGSWQQFIRAIAPIYASDSDYAEKVISIINQYDLYDWNLPSSTTTV